jgi:hypothetical protein
MAKISLNLRKKLTNYDTLMGKFVKNGMSRKTSDPPLATDDLSVLYIRII